MRSIWNRIDGHQAEQLEFVSCGQMLEDEDNNRREEKLSPAQVRDKEYTHFSFSKNFLNINMQKCSLDVKKGVMSTYPKAS